MSADLINRKALINILEDVEQDGLLKVCQIIELLEDQPKAYEDTGMTPDQIVEQTNAGWIPVEDRLPEEYGEYLVTIVPSAGYLWAKRIIANFSDLMGIVKKPIFYTGEVGKIDFEDITDMVIAWRPLPEPYRLEVTKPSFTRTYRFRRHLGST